MFYLSASSCKPFAQNSSSPGAAPRGPRLIRDTITDLCRAYTILRIRGTFASQTVSGRPIGGALWPISLDGQERSEIMSHLGPRDTAPRTMTPGTVLIAISPTRTGVVSVGAEGPHNDSHGPELR
jgi:hypothetical protein